MRALLCSIALTALLYAQGPAKGPLRRLPSNVHWFTDGTGKAVFLAGSHVWWNLQDNNLLMPKGGDPPPVFDYDGYLNFLVRHNHNFFRMWRWEAPKWVDRPTAESPLERYSQPHPWERTGPGEARDGKPRFDLTRFNAAYFDRLRSRVAAARDRGIYVAVMLFEGYPGKVPSAWEHHPYNLPNNINGIDGDGMTYYIVQKTAMGKRVLDLQEAYVRKVIDTLNDLDNVLWEICNEAEAYSAPWQNHLIRYIKQYEQAKPKQHPVGITSMYPDGVNATLFRSPADWVSPRNGLPEENYRADPSPDTKGKVVVNDTDHLGGYTVGDAVWVWKSFLRGLNTILMENMAESPTWQDSARVGMGQAQRYAQKVDLAAMKPAGELCLMQSGYTWAGYCLAAKGREYLVLQTGNTGQFRVDLRDAAGSCSVEWLDVTADRTVVGQIVKGGAQRTFVTPFGGPAVLYLKCSN
ncbi:MAG: hypothetical protein KJZ78_01745 [Bryobacteraceae bacterium]|nr:hypothetical protein [Bryobacteraceae bacterium]